MSNFHAMLNESGVFSRTGARMPVSLRQAGLRHLADALERERDRLAQAVATDLGKRRSEFFADEFLPLRDNIRDLIRRLPRLARVRRRGGILSGDERIMPEPYGLVLIRGYWSDPIRSALEPLAAALAAGNRAVLRPALKTPASAQLLTEILEPLFPDGEVLAAGREIADGELEAEHFDLIVGLETPGKNPVIVDVSANVRRAARSIVRAKIRNAGQSPDAPDCVLAHSRIRSRLLYEMQCEVRARFSGDPELADEPYRVLNSERFEVLRKLLERGRLAAGGESDRARLYIAPTILDGITPADPIMREAVAGPLLPVLEFRMVDEAAEIVNALDMPPTVCCFAGRRTAGKLLSGIRAGSAIVNGCVSRARYRWCGVGAAGRRVYTSRDAFDVFSRLTPVGLHPRFLPEFDRAVELIRKLFRR